MAARKRKTSEEEPNHFYQLSAETFFAQTARAFSFLETEYGYQRQAGELSGLDDFRDARAEIRYTGSRVGVGIYWTLAGGEIGISFVECLEPGVFPPYALYWFPDGHPDPHAAKGAGLYTLAEMQGQRADPAFLLAPADNERSARNNGKIIQAHMPAVLAGLARATQTYARSILQGDTSIFPQALAFCGEKLKQRYIMPSK